MDQKGGFGIAGHRNNYSTGIRNGNWVEDTIGGKLADKVKIEGYGGTQTETQRMQHMGDGKFVGESLVAQSAHAQGQMMTGIPKSLLFYHGNDLLERGGSPADFYATTAQRMNAKSGMNHLAKGPLDTSKSKYMRDEREEKEAMTFTTTQTLDQKSAARSMPSEEAHPTAKPYDGPLARERGYRTFSGSYFAGIKNLRA